jgi:hypothetical protein
MDINLRSLARIGASIRLQEIDRESAAIRAAFPNLRGGPAAAAERPRKRRMSAAGRAAIIAAAKKRWAEWRRKKA